jgi:hypothetical protein
MHELELQFPIAMTANEAAGLVERAAKLKTVAAKRKHLEQANDLVSSYMEAHSEDVDLLRLQGEIRDQLGALG